MSWGDAGVREFGAAGIRYPRGALSIVRIQTREARRNDEPIEHRYATVSYHDLGADRAQEEASAEFFNRAFEPRKEKAMERPLGLMAAYGFEGHDVRVDLAIARQIGASLIETLADWKANPNPRSLAKTLDELELKPWSVHACWGGRTIRAKFVDLASTDRSIRDESIEDIFACIDWLAELGGSRLIVHPGGISSPDQATARSEALADSLALVARRARSANVVVCVENMPPGVHPGSRIADTARIVAAIADDHLMLALDTGHAHLNGDLIGETEASAGLLSSTHVHDNAGDRDLHLPPGLGTIDWEAWGRALDRIDYQGPIILECIKYLREHVECVTNDLIARSASIVRGGGSSLSDR